VWAAIPRVLSTRVPHDHLAPRAALAAVREGREANLAVVRRDQGLTLEIDRWWQGQDRPTHQIMAAHLPMLVHPTAQSALVAGVGAGQTPERFTFHGGLRRLDAVDIEPAVFDLIEGHFASGWMRDPRVRLLREDGRGYLMHGSTRYDVVSLEVGQISRPGVAAFYTLEMYRAVRGQLAPGGIVSRFVRSWRPSWPSSRMRRSGTTPASCCCWDRPIARRAWMWTGWSR
jgi:spermidine synthase